MVTLTGELLSPLIVIFIPLMVLLFAFRTKIPYGNVRQLLIGMIMGIVIYAALMYGSTFKESKIGLEVIIKFLAVGDGAIIYVMFVAVIGIVTLYPFFTKRQLPGYLPGIVVSFTIFEVYFALRCLETIPFLENFGKHLC